MIQLLAAAPLLAPTAVAQDTGHQPPPVFAELGWDGAKAASRERGRFLLLDAMTSWCGPCKVMDATTWVDPEVVAWLEAHAVAVQLDMDEHEDLKTELGISAFPTMVLFDATGGEFDRIVGLRRPDAMLAWLEGARGGTTERQRVVARVAALEADAAPRVADRISLARACASLGADAEAARLVRWLWAREAVGEDEAALLRRWRSHAGPSLSAELVARVPSLAPALVAERDRRAELLAAGEEAALRAEWIVLNDALDQDGRTLRWAAAAAATERGLRALRAQSTRVFDPLVDAGMWATAGAALADPLGRVRFLGDNLGAYDADPGTAPDPGGAPRSVPAIPMGAMKPARPAEPAAGSKAIPAVPMVPVKGAPAGRSAEPAAPAGAPVPAIPMIPMAGGPAAPAPATDPALDRAAAIAAEVRARLTHELRAVASRRYGALLAAGRAAEAEAVAAALLGYADGPEARAHLVACALRAGRLEARRDVHLRWLEEAARVR